MKKTICLLLILCCVSLFGCRKSPPPPLRVACHDDLMPVMTLLGREYRDKFGLAVEPLHYHADDFTSAEPINYDFLVTDDLALVKRLQDDGIINVTVGFAHATPVMVFRDEDKLAISSLEDLAKLDRSLRMTIASDGATLSQIVKAGFERNKIPLQGEEGAKIRQLPFSPEKIESDGTRGRTTPDDMLQRLRKKETDVVVFWDFVATETLDRREDAESFVVVKWPQNERDTITISLCLLSDCTEFSGCKVFVDFIKSNRGNELLSSCFLSPSDELVKETR